MNQCGHVSIDGKQCGANPLSDDSFCYFHSPLRADERKRTASAGGKSPRKKRAKPTLEFHSHTDLADFLDRVQNGFSKGKISADVAKSLVSLVSILGSVRQRMAIENESTGSNRNKEAIKRIFAEKFQRSIKEEFQLLNYEDKSLVLESLRPLMESSLRFRKIFAEDLDPKEVVGHDA